MQGHSDPDSASFEVFRCEYLLLKRWLFDKALPVWSEFGVDWEHGGFFEKINQDGSIVEEPRRTRLVARQIFAFATSTELGWNDRSGLVAMGLDFLLDKCFSKSGTVYRTVSPSGEAIDDRFDLYDHAFALLALATASRGNYRDQEAICTGERLLEAMRQNWKHPVAGFEETRPPSEPLNSNQHMHLLEAFIEWEGLGREDLWQPLTDETGNLALVKFIDPATGGIREHYDHDWNPAAGDIGRYVEPGHQFEWAWLLWRWSQLRDLEDLAPRVLRLVSLGEGFGVNRVTRLAINGLWDDCSIRDSSSRLWPQTERIKANVAAAEVSSGKRRAIAVGLAADATHSLQSYFATKVPGLWHETLDASGVALEAPAKASSLYHIVCAAREIDRFLKRHDSHGC